ncbi:nectin-2-like protein, partial [Leptotrombidium deliense]
KNASYQKEQVIQITSERLALITRTFKATIYDVKFSKKLVSTFQYCSFLAVYPELKIVVGSSAQLPCNISSPTDDSIQLILWYKSSTGVDNTVGTGPPFYTVDARSAASLQQSKHFLADSYRERITFNLSVHTATLHIDSVREDDASNYSCRVDYKWSRTSISVTRLFVVVPPKDVIVIDKESGARLHTVAGPYKEGSDLRLKCVAIGGKPSPSLIWFFDNQMIDDSYFTENTTENVVNELLLKQLKRDFVDSVLSCKADNYYLLPPISASLRLEIYRKYYLFVLLFCSFKRRENRVVKL